MQVKMLVGLSGRNGVTGKPWPKYLEVADLPADQAVELIRKKMAEAVNSVPVEAKMDTSAMERAVVPKAIATEKVEAPAKRGRGRPRKNG